MFGINIVLAAALAGFMQGGGIALALTIASAVNTGLLLYFLTKSDSIDVRTLLTSAAGFTVKMLLFSLIAAAPLYFFGARLYDPLAAYPRIIAQGLPLFISAALFALIILTLLLITGDSLLKTAVQKIRRR